MREFFKNNLLAILVSLCAIGVYASATTITRPYGSPDYAGGAKAVGSKVNAEFDNIVNWLNGGNIASDNIAALGIAGSNIAAHTITADKISRNYKVTASSGVFSIADSNTTLQTITNQSTTITTYGNPVRIKLVPASYSGSCNGSVGGSYVSFGLDTGGVGTANAYFIRDSSTVAAFYMNRFYANTLKETRLQCSSFEAVDVVAAGTYTYAAKISIADRSGTIAFQVGCCRMIVEEL